MKSGTRDLPRNKDIVFVTLSEWDGPRRIRHHLANEFAKQGNRLLFIEAYYTLSKFVKDPDVSKLLQFLRRPREIKKNLFILSVNPFLPLGEFSSIISRVNWTIARFFMRRKMNALGFKDPLLVVFAYNASSIVGHMGERRSVYFCNDAFDKLYKQEWLRRKVVSLEQRLIKKADAVITVSEKLTKEKSRFARKITTVHHGVEYDLFEETLRNAAVPEELSAIKKPVVGYSGVVRHIIDLDLLEYVASSRPEWSIVIVGPVTESDRQYYDKVDALKKRGNVHFLGTKPSDEIPRYISQFDVCLLPYALDEVSTYYTAPLKFYEYLAAGKPVVSTVGPKGGEESLVLNVSTKEAFLAAIEKAFTLTSPRQVKARKEEARKNSWKERVREIEEFIATV